jgi:5-methylcytosine-specific restriction endonuclease McrA
VEKMSAADELKTLKPTEMQIVMDLLRDADFDVSAWADYKGTSPSANPKYCYSWSFEQPGEMVAVCLWYRDIKIHGSHLVYKIGTRKPLLTAPRAAEANWMRRSRQLRDKLRLAYEQELPLRAIIIEGQQSNAADPHPKASKVSRRLLDSSFWAVVEWNATTGDILLQRGACPVPYESAPLDPETSWFEGRMRKAFILHRRREGSARRAKIRDAVARSGGELLCEVPKCGFNFRTTYGSLGEGYAQVHHLHPLKYSPHSGREVKLSDLAIVCANCHAMIHIGGKCREMVGLIP